MRKIPCTEGVGEAGVNDKKSKKLQKLSALLPDASLAATSKRLASLTQLTRDGAELGEDLSRIAADLRAVAAPAEQPFIFTNNLDENEKLLQVVFRDCSDISFRRVQVGDRRAMMVFMDGMSDRTLLEKSILETMMKVGQDQPASISLKKLVDQLLTVASLVVNKDAREAIEAVMSGQALVMIDGIGEVIVIHTAKYVKRSVQEATTEELIRGPHDAFNETITDNIVLVRRRSRDTNLKVRLLQLGERTKTDVAMLYVANLVKPGLQEEVERRLRAIKVDKVILSATIEENIIDHPWSPFPQIQSTERPDKVVAALYEGRVAIIVDNTPFVLIVPGTYATMMQSGEDYTSPPIVSSLIRLTRHISGFIAIYLPAIYISIVSFHPGMMPTTLAISIAELRARTPFPSLLEAIIMEGFLEIFQEAIVRLPKKIAGGAGVVGALVIGTTVVEAGLVNPLLVVVIALTGIASYSMPMYNFAMGLRFLRIPMLILASVLGLYGVMLGYLLVTIHLCSLRSFGESFLGDILDITLLEDWKDNLVRFPSTLLRARSKIFGPQERTRRGDPDA